MVKFEFPLVASIFTFWLCMKHVSEIGVLMLRFFLLFPFPLSTGSLLALFLLINSLDCGLFLYPHLFISPFIF